MSHPKVPEIVDEKKWKSELEALLAKEKELTRQSDEVNALRRRLPMYRIDHKYLFESENGSVDLHSLFDGRNQLIVYHFMFAPDWDQGCPGCSWVVDAMTHQAHLNARGVSLVLVSKAPFNKLQEYKKRMGWDFKWVSSGDSDFNRDFGATSDSGENHGVSVFFRDGDHVFRSYHTGKRGVEHLGSHWTYLDLTPYGRKEEWENSPDGWPQNKTYSTDRRHDEYESDGREL
jgi:predicted dithiol-disulfide oxidoreductase (DUF899 family)